MLIKKNYKLEENRFSFAMPIMKCYEQVTMTAAGEVKERFIEGSASSTDVDLHGDMMAPSAIKSMAASIKDHLIGLNAEHDKSWQSELGDVVKLSVDDKNRLLMKAKLDITSKANDLWLALTVKKKELGLSIGGFVKDYTLEWDKQKEKFMRVYKDIELDHIAVTSTPANPKTWVGAIAKSISKMERLNELDFKDMSKDQMAEFLKRSFSCLGEENTKKLLTNFSLIINKKDSMLEKKKPSLESEEEKDSTDSENKEEEKKDSSELDEEEKETDSEKQDDEEENKEDSTEDEEESEDSEEEAESEEDAEEAKEDEEESEEKAEEEKEEEKPEEVEDKIGDACTMADGKTKGTMQMVDGKMACSVGKTKKSASSDDKPLTREDVAAIASESVQKGLKEFFSSLFKKEEKEEDKNKEEEKKEETEKSEETEKTPAELFKSILEQLTAQDKKIEQLVSKKTVNRKTVKSIALNKDEEEDSSNSAEGVFKTVDEELVAVKKKFSNDPEKAFIECGKVRKMWAEKA